MIGVSYGTGTICGSGDARKTEAVQNVKQGVGRSELVRSGMSGLERGQYSINEDTKEKGEFNYGKNVL